MVCFVLVSFGLLCFGWIWFWFDLLCFGFVWFGTLCFGFFWFALFLFVYLGFGLFIFVGFDLLCFGLLSFVLVWFAFLVWLLRRLTGRLHWEFLDPLSDNEIHKTDSAALTSTLTPSTLKLCFTVSERGT